MHYNFSILYLSYQKQCRYIFHVLRIVKKLLNPYLNFDKATIINFRTKFHGYVYLKGYVY